MANNTFTLDRLLCPLTPADFVAEYFEQRPLVQQGQSADRYAGLLSLSEVESLIFSFDIPENHQWLKLVKDGQGIPLTPLLDEHHCLKPSLVMSNYQQGCTIVLNGLQRRWQPISMLCRDIQSSFPATAHVLLKEAISANLYLTPQNTQGFTLHYDGYDTFILQLEGSKHWSIYAEMARFPVTGLGGIQPEQLGAPLYDITLHPGDLLYVPRGYPHAAAATADDYSMHLTLGMRMYSWADALYALMQADEHFRGSLALHSSDHASLQGQLTDLVQRLSNPENLQKEVEQFAATQQTDLAPLPGDYLAQNNLIERIGLESVVCKRYPQNCSLNKQGKRLTVTFPGNTIHYPSSLEAALSFLIAHEQCLVDAIPGITRESQKLLFVRNLVGHGFLKIVQ